MEEIAAVFAESGYSRLPVYHKDVDDIVGVIHEKDFYAARYRGQGNISGCITPVHYTTANADLGLLLRNAAEKKNPHWPSWWMSTAAPRPADHGGHPGGAGGRDLGRAR